MKPRLFVASSSEALGIARALAANLERDAEVTVWTTGFFKTSTFTLEALEEESAQFDFGVFVFTPEDVTVLRGRQASVVRDNVLFEYGLFVGRLGRARCFLVQPRPAAGEGPKGGRRPPPTRLPTDLLGLTPATYDAGRSDGNWRAALETAADDIRAAIRREGPRVDPGTQAAAAAGRVAELERKVGTLESALEAAAADLFGIVEDELGQLAKRLGFGTRDAVTERVTIYAYDDGGFFAPFGRRSPNPKFAQKSRAQYEEDRGCIGRAWEDRWYFRNDYPDPQTHLEDWVDRCTHEGMDPAVARRVRMKSRLYSGHRIDDANGRPLAVVVIEATEPDRYVPADLRDIFGKWERRVRGSLKHARALLPRVTNARRAGY